MNHDIQPARDLIHAVRARLRRAHTVRGAGLFVAVAGAVTVVSFGLDLLLDMPVAVRAVHLAAIVVGAFFVARWAFGPLRAHATDEQFAEAIEHEVPEFEDRLVSSLDFEKRVADPAEPESRPMMAAAVREASAIASRIDASLLVDGRPARRALLLAVAGVAAVIGTELALPEEFALWLRRGVLLQDVAWPRRTTILVEGFPSDGPRVVTRGDDLRVIAVAEGWRPADVDLHMEEFADGPDGTPGARTFRDVRKMFPVPDQPGRYQFDFRAVSASFRFWVTGGDDTDERPVYEVKALIPPRVASFEAQIEYPAYTGFPPATVKEPTFDALGGSVVTLRFVANMPLAAARLVPSAGAVQDLPLAADGKSFSTSFTLAETVEFHLELKAVAGHVNRSEDDVFRVQAVTDHPPTVRMLHPHGRVVATPGAVIPIKLFAEDDFGVAEATLALRQGTTAAYTGRLWTAPAAPAAPVPGAAGAPAASAAPQKRVHVYKALDLNVFKGDSGLQVKAGDVLSLVVNARDFGGFETEGPEVSVELISVEDLAQRLSGEMTKLRDDLTQTRRSQRKAVGAVRDLAAAVSASGGADASAVRRGRDVQVDEGRVANEVVRFTTGIQRVFDAYVLDRVGSIPTVDRLLPLYDEFLAKAPDDSGEVFPAALYARILEEKRANRLYDPEILGILLDVQDLSQRLREKEAPAAYDAIERWAADGPHDPAALTEATRAAEQVLATLDAMDERLQKFEDMAAILQLARNIHSAETDLTRKSANPEKPR